MNKLAHPNNLLHVNGYQIRVWLLGVEPVIWRRLLIRSDHTFADLHTAIQVLFGWRNDLLYRFIINGGSVGSSETLGTWTTESADKVWLADFTMGEGQRFRYEYGLRKSWAVEVRVERWCELDGRKHYPTCIAGKQAAPPPLYVDAAAFMQASEMYTPAYVNERMLAMCDTLLSENLCAPEWEPEVHEMQSELEGLRFWLVQEIFDRRAVNRRLKVVTGENTDCQVEKGGSLS